jgi:tetratricopeptide (TPR) repeat protein
MAADALKHLNAGLLMLQKGELDAAASEFRRSVAQQPFAARPHFYLGKIHERKEERYDAMFEYEQALALDSTFFPAVKDLALLYQNAGFVQKAVEMWQQALAICPEPSMRQTIKDHILRLI